MEHSLNLPKFSHPQSDFANVFYRQHFALYGKSAATTKALSEWPLANILHKKVAIEPNSPS